MVILMFHVYNSLDLCSFMDMSFTSVLIWIYICSFMDVMFNQPERRSTHVRIRMPELQSREWSRSMRVF